MGDEREGGSGDGFSRYELGDGLTLHVLRTPKFKTVTVRVAVRRSLTADEVAANACIPFVLRRGSERHPDTRSIERFLESLYGAQFWVDSVKVGETQVLDFGLEVVADRYVGDSVQPVREGLRFLGDVLLRPRLEAGGFRPSVVAQEVDVLKRRIEGLFNDKPQYALERLRQTMCAGEPFGLHRYGTPDRLDALDARTLYEHYERVLRRSPIDVFVVGDVDPERLQGWVREAMPFPRGAVEYPDRPVQVIPHEVREVQEEEEVHQGIIAMGYRSPLRYPDDGYERLLMYNGILGGYPHSKLFMNVRERASLAYFAGSRLDSTKGIIVVFAGIDPEKYAQAREIMERQAADMAAGRIGDEEMEATRKALIRGLRTAADDADSLVEYELLGVVNGRRRRPEETVRALASVTREQVAEVARSITPDTVYFLTRTRSPLESGAGDSAPAGGGHDE